VQWWKHDCSERFQYLKPLVSKIHLDQVPMDLLLSFKQDPLLADTEVVSQINKAVNLILEERYEKQDIKSLWELYHKKPRLRGRYSMEQEVQLFKIIIL
jgi:hypothetical protein